MERFAGVRIGLAGMTLLGVVGWIAMTADWPNRPGYPSQAEVALELGVFAFVSGVILLVALLAPRIWGILPAVPLLGYGIVGSWAYGFLWVPGAVAILAIAVPRPVRPQPTMAEAHASGT